MSGDFEYFSPEVCKGVELKIPPVTVNLAKSPPLS